MVTLVRRRPRGQRGRCRFAANTQPRSTRSGLRSTMADERGSSLGAVRWRPGRHGRREPRHGRVRSLGRGRQFFGPGSAVWAVNGALPTLVAGIRALFLQTLHPGAMAGVHDWSRYNEDPLGRLDGTVRWVAMTMFGDRRSATAASAFVSRLHEHVRGTYVDALGVESPLRGERRTAAPLGARRVHRGVHRRPPDLGGPIPGGPDAYVREWAQAGRLMGVQHQPPSVAALHAEMDAFLVEAKPDERVATAVSFLRKPGLPGLTGRLYPILFGGAVASLDPLPQAARAAATLVACGDPDPALPRVRRAHPRPHVAERAERAGPDRGARRRGRVRAGGRVTLRPSRWDYSAPAQRSTRRARSVFQRLGSPSGASTAKNTSPRHGTPASHRPSSARLPSSSSIASAMRESGDRRPRGSSRAPAARRRTSTAGRRSRVAGEHDSPVDRRRKRLRSSRYSSPPRRASVIAGSGPSRPPARRRAAPRARRSSIERRPRRPRRDRSSIRRRRAARRAGARRSPRCLRRVRRSTLHGEDAAVDASSTSPWKYPRWSTTSTRPPRAHADGRALSGSRVGADRRRRCRVQWVPLRSPFSPYSSPPQ